MTSFFRVLPHALVFLSYVSTVYGQGSGSGSGQGAPYGTLSSSVDVGITGRLGDDAYTTEIVLGGQNFTVMVDTGSSDLWVDARKLNLHITNDTGVGAEFAYAIGAVQGKIQYAELQIGPYVIPNQVFVSATKADPLPDNILGIIGMAFDTAAIFTVLTQVWGLESAQKLARSPITNLFAQNPSAPAYFDLQLSRADINNVEHDGHFLFGQHAQGMEAIEQAPKFERVGTEHWTLVMDGMKINGKPFTGWNKSVVAGIPDGKLATVFDSGYTYPQIPQVAVDAIYSSIPGAVPYHGAIPGTDNGGNVTNWIVPCNASTNLTFTLGGQDYPVHPRDIITLYNGVKLDTVNGIDMVANASICLNTYQTGTPDDEYDMLLGMAFLRNVYGSFHYGDYTPPGNVTTGVKPYVQFLSVIEQDTAWADFNNYTAQRLAKSAPAADPASFVKLLNSFASKTQASAASGSGAASVPAGSSTRSTASVSTTASATSTPASAKVNADTAQNLAVSGAAAGSSADDSEHSDKYGVFTVALSAASVAIGLAGLSVSLFMCIRGVKGRRGLQYKPLRMPKEEAAGFASERGALYRD
ncbi:acid protease [Cubamyces sp. BRFM 1775]|nr:acid protease [Cubamyces sp. BRFM 1775]